MLQPKILNVTCNNSRNIYIYNTKSQSKIIIFTKDDLKRSSLLLHWIKARCFPKCVVCGLHRYEIVLRETLVGSPFENLFILSLEKFFDVNFLQGIFTLITSN